MPRILGAERHVLNIRDNLSGTDIQLSYRLPSTTERNAYTTSSVQRRGRKVVSRIGEARQQYGLAILTGIRDGDFAWRDAGKTVPLSSTPGHKGYREDWKDLVLAHASDLVELLAAQVFDMPAMVDEAGGEDIDGDAGEDIDQD